MQDMPTYFSTKITKDRGQDDLCYVPLYKDPKIPPIVQFGDNKHIWVPLESLATKGNPIYGHAVAPQLQKQAAEFIEKHKGIHGALDLSKVRHCDPD